MKLHNYFRSSASWRVRIAYFKTGENASEPPCAPNCPNCPPVSMPCVRARISASVPASIPAVAFFIFASICPMMLWAYSCDRTIPSQSSLCANRIIAGVTTMLANAAGPVMGLYLLAVALPKDAFVGTAADHTGRRPLMVVGRPRGGRMSFLLEVA